MVEKTHVCLTAFYHINYKCIFPWVVLSLAQGIFHCPGAFAEENWLGRRLPSRWRETANASVCECCCLPAYVLQWCEQLQLKIPAEAAMIGLARSYPYGVELTQIGPAWIYLPGKMWFPPEGITDISSVVRERQRFHLGWPRLICLSLLIFCFPYILSFSSFFIVFM